MPRCKNVPEDQSPVYYSGNENTPRGKGWCARHEPEGKVRVGTDGKKYCVKGNRWVAHRKSHSKKSPSKRKTSPRLDKEEKELKVKDAIILNLKAFCKQKDRLICRDKDFVNANRMSVQHLKNFISKLKSTIDFTKGKLSLEEILKEYAIEQQKLNTGRKDQLKNLVKNLYGTRFYDISENKKQLKRLETVHPNSIAIISKIVQNDGKLGKIKYKNLKDIIDSVIYKYKNNDPNQPGTGNWTSFGKFQF